MKPAHIDALVRMEIRRVGALLARVYLVIFPALTLLLYLTGKGTPDNVFGFAIGMGAGTVLFAPLTVKRDKVERTLEFLQALPVTASTLVAARFVAAALSVLPSAILAGIPILLLPPPPELELVAGFGPLTFMVGYWILLTTVTWVLIAAAISLDLATFLKWPLIGLVALYFTISFALRRWVPADPEAAIRWFFSQAWAGPVVVALVGTLLVLVAAASFFLARWGFARYQPRLDSPL
jgi:hypothetical protein